MPTVHNMRAKTASEGAVYIGRPSKWGNPFTIGRDGTRADVVRKYRAWLPTQTQLVEDAKEELRGRDLVCFCAPEACHGDVLLEVANAQQGLRTIIAGSREVDDYRMVQAAVQSSGFAISVVLSGCARGADQFGERWAHENGVPVEKYPANWGRNGSVDKAAGHKRNREMGDNADALIAIWDGKSPGTKGMIDYARKKGLQVYVHGLSDVVVNNSAIYTVYCDGASRKDGRGGWGASIRQHGEPNVDLYGGEFDTTNNRMELMGALEALWYIPEHSVVHVYGDSEYVVKGAPEYLETWARTGWRTSSNKPLKNDDLWQEMQGAIARHALVEWFWVKGHSGDEGNERADALSQMGVPEPR